MGVDHGHRDEDLCLINSNQAHLEQIPHDMGPVQADCVRSPTAGCLQDKSKQPPKKGSNFAESYVH